MVENYSNTVETFPNSILPPSGDPHHHHDRCTRFAYPLDPSISASPAPSTAAAAMLEATCPTTKKLPPPSRIQPPPAPAPNPLPYHHHHYGTFPPPPVEGAAYHASQIGFGSQGVVAFPGTVQQQIFVEGVPVQEPPLPFCGIGIGWFLFLLGFFLAAIPWYAGAFLLFFVALDHREKPGLIACTVVYCVLCLFILQSKLLRPFNSLPSN
ncbi:hypothetical protein PAHAL_4G030400 [Panicum hallii]|uniref:60S ribosomal protein L18a-like protein n=1 Tax=Panicum hallii TaxID=206008 RepID=A0A2T8JBJ6_9POAL|nr:hypothetical protein PAHAL_4G030400 [Panicum hallii]